MTHSVALGFPVAGLQPLGRMRERKDAEWMLIANDANGSAAGKDF
jgi:hypothetical protein